MDIDRLLRVGTRLAVQRPSSDIQHLARIEDVALCEYAISTLFGGVEGEVLTAGEKVHCTLTDAEGQAQYGFECVVLRREMRVVPLYFLSKPEQVIREQRRGFVRTQVLLSAEYQLLNDERWHRTYLVDISGSGVKMSHSEQLTPGEAILISFRLDAKEPRIYLQGRVVRSTTMNSQDGLVRQSGIEFHDIAVGIQDRIVAYVFERLLELRRTREARG